MALTPRIELLVQVYHKDGTIEPQRYECLQDAFSNIRDQDCEIDFVFKIERDTFTGKPNGVNYDEEFETFWLEREQEERADEWHEDKPNWTLQEHLRFCEGPPFRKPSQRQRKNFIKAIEPSYRVAAE